MNSRTPEWHEQVEAACKRLVLDAVNCADRQDYAGLAALFLPDGVLYRPAAPDSPLQGRAAIQASYQGRPANRVTRHCCSNFRVEVESAGSARVRCYVQVFAAERQPSDGALGAVWDGHLIVGEFDDRCVMTADGWRIAERRASFIMHRDL